MSKEKPHYEKLTKQYAHLKGVSLEDSDKKQALPDHLNLGASEYAKIKTTEAQRAGEMRQPIAEKTKFGWAIMSPGKEPNIDKLNFAHSSNGDYEMLCRLYVLGHAHLGSKCCSFRVP